MASTLREIPGRSGTGCEEKRVSKKVKCVAEVRISHAAATCPEMQPATFASSCDCIRVAHVTIAADLASYSIFAQAGFHGRSSFIQPPISRLGGLGLHKYLAQIRRI
ncbi:hypothetical protein GGTG_06696 [Gaeumannomyces tritici R3-111a-1]|uniref:Uncharacterized protein n=1 Tax=Gaeumannomyces tritici (strain R3-111a-1) TaxID=644352 RepID=J3NZJ8_GAET3|nr:hypothetical protein GGTG_06696 [Gaeumannomyces tritici R3-111a-1]EJT76781.1 hypothetical protein GGTG_06696 [Gaeumannomyces tritici R3-111a-1]